MIGLGRLRHCVLAEAAHYDMLHVSKGSAGASRAAQAFEMPRLHNVVRTGDGAALPITYEEVARARPRHVMSLSNGAAPSV